MTTTHFKRIAVTAALSGALGFAALGLGAGVASADDDATGSTSSFGSDWQSYIPQVTNLLGGNRDLGLLNTGGPLQNVLSNGSFSNVLSGIGG